MDSGREAGREGVAKKRVWGVWPDRPGDGRAVGLTFGRGVEGTDDILDGRTAAGESGQIGGGVVGGLEDDEGRALRK